jgi:hypothetical protein
LSEKIISRRERDSCAPIDEIVFPTIPFNFSEISLKYSFFVMSEDYKYKLCPNRCGYQAKALVDYIHGGLDGAKASLTMQIALHQPDCPNKPREKPKAEDPPNR